MSSETIKDLMPQTPDLIGERIAKLKELFPDFFTSEGQLDEHELRKLVAPNSVNETERYEFRWFGKSRAKRDAFTPSKATLVFDEARSVNPLAAENLIIEGENLEVLKLLLCAYREGIKCIYIDPPYNTGKDFVYNDNYTEGRRPYWEQTGVTENGVRIDTNVETDGRFHSNWMNMLYSRLLVARQLLQPDGVIFVSIDDNEVHNLRTLMNIVFGEENFLTEIVVLTNPKGRVLGSHFARSHEYLLVYSKNQLVEELSIAKTDKETAKDYPESDELGNFRALELRNTHRQFGKFNRENLWFPIYVDPESGEVSLEKETNLVEVFPLWEDGFEGCWTWSASKVSAESFLLVGRKINGSWKIFRKSYSHDSEGNVARKKLKTMWIDKSFHTEKGQSAFDALLPGRLFQSPKPPALIKVIAELGTNTDDIVLDFFGGSGTTGQAVMELNEEDGGNRKFILVQLPELTDEKSEAYKAGFKKLSDITIERNKRVVERLIASKKKAHPNLFENADNTDALKGLGFKVLRLEKSYFPRTDWSPDPTRTEAENVIALKQYIAEKESQLNLSFDRDKLLTEILLKGEGFKLNYRITPYPTVTSNQLLHVTDGDKEALVCLDPTLALETVEHFKTHAELKFICLERALDTTKKWNLHHFLGEKFKAF